MNNEQKIRRFGERVDITNIGEYEVGKFVRFSGHYDLPLSAHHYDEKVFTLDKAISLLESEGYRVACAEEVAQARIEDGRVDSDICLGASTKEALIRLPREGLLMTTKNSPLLSNIRLVHNIEMNFYKHGQLYTPFRTRDDLNEAIQIHPEGLAHEERGKLSIPTERFGEEELTRFLFGKTAKNYGRFLEKIGFKSVPFEDPDGMIDAITDSESPSVVSQFHFNHQSYAGIGFNGILFHDPSMFFIRPAN